MALHSDPAATPTLLDRYQLGEKLGEGASAVVYAALDVSTGQEVAVKRLKPSGVGDRMRWRERFVSEASALAQLAHPHLVHIETVHEDDDGTPFLVMEKLAGRTLAALLAERSLDVGEAYAWLLPIMGALATAHDAGIVHRDVKPANLFLDTRSGAVVPKLLDFGAAKLSSSEGLATTDGMAVGTPCFMSPEQAQGLRPSAATDVWAMGVVWFRCLTGRLPFEAETALGVLVKLSRERAPRLQERMPALSTPLAVALDRALEPDEAARYPDMRSFARALTHAAVQSGLEVPSAPDPRSLPDFARWLQEADTERTGLVEAVPTCTPGDAAPDVPAAASVRAGPRRGVVWSSVAALLLAAVLAGGALWQRGRIESDVAARPTHTQAGPLGARGVTAFSREEAVATSPTTAVRAMSAPTHDPSPTTDTPAGPEAAMEAKAPPIAAERDPTSLEGPREGTTTPRRRIARRHAVAARAEQVAEASPHATAPAPEHTEPLAEPVPEPPATPPSTTERQRVIEDFNW